MSAPAAAATEAPATWKQAAEQATGGQAARKQAARERAAGERAAEKRAAAGHTVCRQAAGSDSLAQRGSAGLRVAIMTDEIGWHTRQVQRALRGRGAEGRCLDLAACRIDTTAAWHGLVLPGFGRRLPDAVLVRGIAGGSFEQVTKRLGILHALREFGVPVYNDARAIERSVDKSMTSVLLHAAGVPTPPTWAMESAEDAQRLVTRESAAGRSLVLKPLFGSQGSGLVRVGRVDGAHVPLPPLAGAYGSLAYLQRFVAAQAAPGHDWRVLVVGGVARAAMRRVSEHWVHNVAQGARCEPQPLDGRTGAQLARLAVAAAEALGMDYAGVDLLPTPDGIQVIEVNGVAAWQGLQRVTPANLAQALVDDLLDRKLQTAKRMIAPTVPAAPTLSAAPTALATSATSAISAAPAAPVAPVAPVAPAPCAALAPPTATTVVAAVAAAAPAVARRRA